MVTARLAEVAEPQRREAPSAAADDGQPTGPHQPHLVLPNRLALSATSREATDLPVLATRLFRDHQAEALDQRSAIHSEDHPAQQCRSGSR